VTTPTTATSSTAVRNAEPREQEPALPLRPRPRRPSQRGDRPAPRQSAGQCSLCRRCHPCGGRSRFP